MPKFESGKKEEIAEKQTHAFVSAADRPLLGIDGGT